MCCLCFEEPHVYLKRKWIFPPVLPSQSPQQGPRLKVWFPKDQVGEYGKSMTFMDFTSKKNQHPNHWENLVTAFFIHGTKISRIYHLRKWFSHESQDQKEISSRSIYFLGKVRDIVEFPALLGSGGDVWINFVFVQPGVVDYQDSKNEKVSEFRPFQIEKPWHLQDTLSKSNKTFSSERLQAWVPLTHLYMKNLAAWASLADPERHL